MSENCPECGRLTDEYGDAINCYGDYCAGSDDCESCGGYECSGAC